MIELIDRTKADGDTIGGVVECIITGLPVGLGSHVQWDRKLDGRIAQAVVSINAFKGVEVGIGFEAARIQARRYTTKFCIPKKRASIAALIAREVSKAE